MLKARISYALVVALTLTIVKQFLDPRIGWRWAAIIYAGFSVPTVIWLAALLLLPALRQVPRDMAARAAERSLL